MKKIIAGILFILMLQTSGLYTAALEIDDKPAPTEKSECKWVNLHQTERDAKIKYFKENIFTENSAKSIKTSEFRKQFRGHLKDARTDKTYKYVLDGITETNEYYISGYFKRYTDAEILYSYALQPKTDIRHIYYYNAAGNLLYMDSITGMYPRYPYLANRYNAKGKLLNIILFEDKDTQYVYKRNGKFEGYWYKDRMYNRKGNEIYTRTNW